jgi:NAD(P)-dependent dehydrogenase (short-subunit alcohol dehydrogenase family)
VSLEGQRAVVFGGASGAGLASAKLLAARGADVVIAGRRAARLESEGHDFRFSAHEVDGKDVDAVERLFADLGGFDHLVITAGQTNRGGSFVEQITDKTFRDTFDGKFWVQVSAAHAGARRIRRGGSITFFSGGASRRAMRGMANIAAVNGALDAIVPTLALELAPTRVNSVSPGTLRTSYWTGLADEEQKKVFDHVAAGLPAGRVGTAEDIANAVLYLVTTSFVTGTVLAVDGGLPHSAL